MFIEFRDRVTTSLTVSGGEHARLNMLSHCTLFCGYDTSDGSGKKYNAQSWRAVQLDELSMISKTLHGDNLIGTIFFLTLAYDDLYWIRASKMPHVTDRFCHSEEIQESRSVPCQSYVTATTQRCFVSL